MTISIQAQVPCRSSTQGGVLTLHSVANAPHGQFELEIPLALINSREDDDYALCVQLDAQDLYVALQAVVNKNEPAAEAAMREQAARERIVNVGDSIGIGSRPTG